MKKFLNKINYCLDNEEGNVHVETLVGVALALGVAVGLFEVYRHIRSELESLNYPTGIQVSE